MREWHGFGSCRDVQWPNDYKEWGMHQELNKWENLTLSSRVMPGGIQLLPNPEGTLKSVYWGEGDFLSPSVHFADGKTEASRPKVTASKGPGLWASRQGSVLAQDLGQLHLFSGWPGSMPMGQQEAVKIQTSLREGHILNSYCVWEREAWWRLSEFSNEARNNWRKGMGMKYRHCFQRSKCII